MHLAAGFLVMPIRRRHFYTIKIVPALSPFMYGQRQPFHGGKGLYSLQAELAEVKYNDGIPLRNMKFFGRFTENSNFASSFFDISELIVRGLSFTKSF